MEVTVNGESREVPEGATIAVLLESLDLNVSHVAVERNQELVTRKEHATTTLAPDDAIEIVTLVGGG